MNPFRKTFKPPMWLIPSLLLTAVAGCGGGHLDPILGTPPVGVAPTVTTTSPLASTPVVTGVAVNGRVQATFSKPMATATLTPASFTLACPVATAITGAVSYDATTKTTTLTPAAALPPSTLCVATLTTAVQDSLGFALASNFTWSFMTGVPDTTRPSVVLTLPTAGTPDAVINTAVTATFSEAMDPATINATSFTLTNTTLDIAVTGSVSYSAAARTATFTPTSPATLAANSTFNAVVSTVATDLAGNALAGNTAALPAASNYQWTFSTSALSDTTAPTVVALSPLDAATGVCLTQVVSATFSKPMNAATINTSTFGVTDNGVAVAGNVSYDAASKVASFAPSNATGFVAGRPLVATLKSGPAGVMDLAGNALAADRVWGFTIGSQACTAGVNLQTAGAFGAFGGGAGVTNSGINTVVNGSIGTTAACTLVTGLHDAANVYTETPLNIGVVNGGIFCAPPAPGTATSMNVATLARADALSAYNALAAMPPGSDPGAGQLGGLVLPAAVYTAAGGTFAVTTGDLTLDAQGNANAVWVFQSAAALTVGLNATPRHVLLINGAQAKNVFWQVGSAARIEDGSAMVGTIIAPAGVTVSTAGQTLQTTLTGRAIGLTASVTLVNTTIVAP